MLATTYNKHVNTTYKIHGNFSKQPPFYAILSRSAPGTCITQTRDLSNVLLTSIVIKNSVTLLDIVSSRMVGQAGFLTRVFDTFGRKKVSVDVVATSEVSVSVTLDPKMLPADLGDDSEDKVRFRANCFNFYST